MNSEKTKKILYRILKTIWISLGILLAIVTISMWIKMSTYSGSGFSGVGATIGLALLAAAMIYIFSIYLGITLLFLFIKWLIKKIRKRRKKK